MLLFIKVSAKQIIFSHSEERDISAKIHQKRIAVLGDLDSKLKTVFFFLLIKHSFQFLYQTQGKSVNEQ